MAEPLRVLDRDGSHTFRDRGYSPQHAAHLYVCDEHGCQRIADSDEHKARYRRPAENAQPPGVVHTESPCENEHERPVDE